MFNHFLVPISDDIISKKALKEVAKLAKQAGCKVTLVFISDPSVPYIYMEANAASNSWHKKACGELAQHLFAKAQAQLGKEIAVKTCHLFEENIYEGIIKATHKSKADVIVMASHKRHGLKGIFIGSETHAVIIHTTLPVLVI